MGPRILFATNPEGARVAYTTLGKGPPLVIVPGWVSHLALQLEEPQFRGFVDALERHHRVILFDKTGTGLSERKRTAYTVERDLSDLETVLEAAGTRTVALFAFSEGGPLAIAYAVRHPGAVSHLILCGTYARGAKVSPPHVQATLLSLVRNSWGLGAELFADLFLHEEAEHGATHDLLARFQRESASAETAARILEQLFAEDVAALLPRVQAPTLVIHRTGDMAFRPRLGIELAGGIPNAKLVLLDGRSHWPWLGDTQQVLEPIREFLGDPPEPRPSLAIPAPPTPGRRYEIVHRDFLEGAPERAHCRIGLAQLGTADDLFAVGEDQLWVMPRSRVAAATERIARLVEHAHERRIDLLLFPELTVDLNHRELLSVLLDQARAFGMWIVPGAFHERRQRTNVSRVIGPAGVLWEQPKHIPAIVSFGGHRTVEQLHLSGSPIVVVGATPLGRIAVTTCRDFLDMDLRVALKNADPPVDILLNPAFTPVTADFAAAHFEARRSLYACCVFANFAQFGGSLIHSPEKSRRRAALPPGREGLLHRDLDLFGLRVERQRWELERGGRFIQSTR
jgi:pimeloyl-ACP methyl ester carboxylesterase/predicted amidohydrolase